MFLKKNTTTLVGKFYEKGVGFDGPENTFL